MADMSKYEMTNECFDGKIYNHDAGIKIVVLNVLGELNDRTLKVSGGAYCAVNDGGGAAVVISERLVKDLTDDELSYIIDHEVGHYKLGHYNNKISIMGVKVADEKAADNYAFSNGATRATARSALFKILSRDRDPVATALLGAVFALTQPARMLNLMR